MSALSLPLALRQPCRFRSLKTAIVAEGVSGSDIPRSYESSVGQARQAIRTSLFGGKKARSKKAKSLRRLSVEIPTMDTSVENSLFLTSALLEALEADGRSGTSILYSDDALVAAAKEQFSSNACLHLANASNAVLGSRLLVFNPTADSEDALFTLLDDVWRGEAVLLFNPEFSDDFKNERAAFVQGFDAVYCFMPLAIKVFISNKDGALFRWQKEKGVDAKWLIFIEEGEQFKQIGQQATRPSQTELETAIYNATAAESPITKGFNFLSKLGQGK